MRTRVTHRLPCSVLPPFLNPPNSAALTAPHLLQPLLTARPPLIAAADTQPRWRRRLRSGWTRPTPTATTPSASSRDRPARAAPPSASSQPALGPAVSVRSVSRSGHLSRLRASCPVSGAAARRGCLLLGLSTSEFIHIPPRSVAPPLPFLHASSTLIFCALNSLRPPYFAAPRRWAPLRLVDAAQHDAPHVRHLQRRSVQVHLLAVLLRSQLPRLGCAACTTAVQ